jgi:hypothetical protein
MFQPMLQLAAARQQRILGTKRRTDRTLDLVSQRAYFEMKDALFYPCLMFSASTMESEMEESYKRRAEHTCLRALKANDSLGHGILETSGLGSLDLQGIKKEIIVHHFSIFCRGHWHD